MDTCNVLQSVPDGLIGTVIVVFLAFRFLDKFLNRQPAGQPPPPPADYYPPNS